MDENRIFIKIFLLECLTFICLIFIFIIKTPKTKKTRNSKKFHLTNGKNYETEFIFNFTKNNLSHLNYDINTKEKNIIPIAYSTDNNFLYPTLVSITSLLETIKYNETFYDIYIMISNDFEKNNKDILESVQNHYPGKCKVNFVEMGDMFNEQKVASNKATYYRLALPDKLPNIKKIIYLDGDTMIFDDLTELINLNMSGYYILGFLDSMYRDVEKYGIQNAVVLCAGVLLMDLENLRKFNSTGKFKQFMESHNNTIAKADQDIINAVLHGHLHTLPPKYGMWGFDLYVHAQIHNNAQRPWLKYNETELEEGFKHPAILHYTASKPFKNTNSPYFNIWWNYANKTGYYDAIHNYWLNRLNQTTLK